MSVIKTDSPLCDVFPHISFLRLGEKVMADDEFTCDLFRFLQLLCEGHNNGGWVLNLYQNFTTVNMKICTVIYCNLCPTTIKTFFWFCLLHTIILYLVIFFFLNLFKTQCEFEEPGFKSFGNVISVCSTDCVFNHLWVYFTLDFQNYLRTQTGSTTTINVIICTVDYLLRLQVRSFYPGKPRSNVAYIRISPHLLLCGHLFSLSRSLSVISTGITQEKTS